jgi:HlyD family secretion protein
MTVMMKHGTVSRLAAALCAAAFLAAATGCAPRPGAAGPKPPAGPQGQGPGLSEIAVQTVAVKSGALVVEHQTAGTVKPVMQSRVVGQLSGVVSRMAKKAGDWVEKGDTVIQLDDSQLRLSVKAAEAALEAAKINLSTGQDTTRQANPKLDLQVQSAEAALSSAQRNFDSKKALFDLGGATGAEVDRAKADLDGARANLEAARTALDQNQKADVQNIAQLKLAVQQADFSLQQAQLNLQHAAIRAPFAGRLASINVNPGELVSQSQAAFVLASRDREVDFDIPPADAPALPVGSRVTFSLNGKDYPLAVSESSDVPLNGVVSMAAAVPGSVTLSFGAIGTVSYPITLARGVIVPTGSLQTSENQNFLYIVEGTRALVRPITILAESGATASVTGIDAGSLVVLNPPPGLLDGSTVKAITK